MPTTKLVQLRHLHKQAKLEFDRLWMYDGLNHASRRNFLSHELGRLAEEIKKEERMGDPKLA